jgi:cytochrome c oxidase subunit 6a
MNAQRLGLRIGRVLRSSNVRSTVQRRFESTAEKLPQPGQKLVGPQDNAFNRERAAVKSHAAATSGMSRA